MKKLSMIVASLALLTVIAAGVLSWAPDLPVETLKTRWAQPPSRFVAVDDMQVHLRDQGPADAPVLVLLHGTSASLHTWDGWTEALSGDYRIVRFDLPGFGLTGPAADADYSIRRYARFVVRMLDELGIERAALGGNSLGGQIAWETAFLAPERVSALILGNAAGYPFDPMSMPIGFRLASMPLLEPFTVRFLPRSMIRASVENVYGDPGQITEDLIDRYYDITRRAGNRAALIRRFEAGVSSPDAASRLATLEQPALILWGGKDRLIPPGVADYFDRDMPNSEKVVFDTLGHVPHEEAPVPTAAAVRAFLATHMQVSQ